MPFASLINRDITDKVTISGKNDINYTYIFLIPFKTTTRALSLVNSHV